VVRDNLAGIDRAALTQSADQSLLDRKGNDEIQLDLFLELLQ
jgi:hypothetical protein